MKIITGLGNPGSKYSLNRHNIGFIVLDWLADEMKVSFKPGKGEYYFAQGKFAGEDTYLLKPSTYMNNSGYAVKEFIEFLKPDFELQNLLVVYDDFQLPLGTIRIREKGSDGGHNGISSIIYHMITNEFPRMRIGIGKKDIIRKDEFVDFVLSDFTNEEIETIKNLKPVYIGCIKNFLRTDLKTVMNRFNKNFLPPEDKESKELL